MLADAQSGKSCLMQDRVNRGSFDEPANDSLRVPEGLARRDSSKDRVLRPSWHKDVFVDLNCSQYREGNRTQAVSGPSLRAGRSDGASLGQQNVYNCWELTAREKMMNAFETDLRTTVVGNGATMFPL